MRSEPVLVLLAGLAGVINLGLVAANAVGLTHLDGTQVAAVVAFVTAACGLAAAVLRAQVASPATRDAEIVEALHRTALPVGSLPSVVATSVAHVKRVVEAEKAA